jgi:hypothetical protein
MVMFYWTSYVHWKSFLFNIFFIWMPTSMIWHLFSYLHLSLFFFYQLLLSTKYYLACRRSWSYGSWIYNYLWNQCLSTLMLGVRILLMARCTLYVQHYVIKFVSDLRQVCGFFQICWFPPPIKLTATI